MPIPGCETSAAPASPPVPVITLKTPGGSSAASMTRMNSSVETEASSDGLTTTVLPAASAVATFVAIRNKGEFQAVRAATTP